MMNKNISRKLTLAAALAVMALAAARPAPAYTPLGYPGSAWGTFTRGFDGLEGTGAQGWVRQGVTWFRAAGADFNTYGDYSWRVRTENKTYYNTYGPGLVAAFEKGPFGLGVDYSWMRYPKLGDTVNNAAAYGSWYYSADASKVLGRPAIGGHSPLGLPFSTWGRLEYDMHGAEGSGTQGWVKQGVDWLSLGRGWKLDTYGAYNWRIRSKQRTYYDAVGPSAGIGASGGNFDIGLEYLWQRFPELRTTTRHLNLYLNWFYDWDLKKK
jgi:hypothetical protein